MMEPILFASDLDQTLIYSHRSLPHSTMDASLRPVERLENQCISFMTQGALSLLKELAGQILFVPTTTRTKTQYQRLNFADYGIYPRYVVTSNGGTIFDHGREDVDWAKQVAAGNIHCAEGQDLICRFQEISHPSWVIKDSGTLADDLFYYCVIDRDKLPMKELGDFELWARENRWDLSIQGRKLYFVPRHVSKKAAIEYLREKEGLSTVVAAGDSLLDLEMLKAADIALAPAHGELFSRYTQGKLTGERIQFTKISGIDAAEEILGTVQRILESKLLYNESV
ncbi:HAD family hydrolase [Desulfosporosinus sp. SB140]|uniref:HAD family hydrolase n=1 Tax=Desulfosporosinus paludis TaxID=3115649 RepID=UPI00388FB925